MTSEVSDAADYSYASAGEIHMHSLLIPAISASIHRHHPTSVLDVGCGNGHMTAQLQRQFPDIRFAGIDPSDSGIEHARLAYPAIDFRQGSIYEPAPDDWHRSFDLVFSAEVVEHLYSPRALPKFIAEVLKRESIAVITTPYHGYLKNLALSVLHKWDTHHDVFWDHGHIKFWSRNTLSKLFEDVGYSSLRFEGIGRVPWLWMTMLMEFKSSQATELTDFL